jgi:hypothetical protein
MIRMTTPFLSITPKTGRSTKYSELGWFFVARDRRTTISARYYQWGIRSSFKICPIFLIMQFVFCCYFFPKKQRISQKDIDMIKHIYKMISLFFLTCTILIPPITWAGEFSKPHKLVLIVMDGARYTETLGSPDKSSCVPNIANRIVPAGSILHNVYNNGFTATVPGHAALSTGVYENISNSGSEYPSHPSFMHIFLSRNLNPNAAWLITSKDMLEALAYEKTRTQKKIRSSCGFNGYGSGHRDDAQTLAKVFALMDEYTPDVVFINFKGPDSAGHSGVWKDYCATITRTDSFVGEIFDYIQKDPDYKGNTNLIVVNDHGRHSDGINGGFANHGCQCEGCRHIMCVGFGPDFRKGFVSTANHEQTDIAVTAAFLLGFDLPSSTGKVIDEILI